MMNTAHHRGQLSTSSVVSFDESNEHATDYISGMYQDFSPDSSPPRIKHHHRSPSPPKYRGSSSPPSNPSSTYNRQLASINTTPSPPTPTKYQRSKSSDSIPTSPNSKSPTLTRPKLRAPSPPPLPLSTQMPLSGLKDDDDGSAPSSPDEIAKELSNLQAFKRMSLDVSNQVSDPDLPSKRISVPDLSELMEAGVDEDAARLLWVPAHIHPEIAANDEWKTFVQKRVEETKSTGTISRVKSISGGSARARLSRSKSILSRQIDTSDEATWSKYSDAGHRELERRGSNKDTGHMITVNELEKLEALIKEGALERPRPVSAESLEMAEVLPLAADAPPPVEDTAPLMPVKGTLKRSAHTSMRNVRRGGRSGRRVSEPKRDQQKQISVFDDPRARQEADLPPVHERSESMPLLTRALSNPEYHPQSSSVDRTSAPPELGQAELQNLTSQVPEIRQPTEPIIEGENAVLGQVQPRQLRRPPLRRQTIDAPEKISSTSASTVQPPLSPTKDRVPPKKSPVSPTFSPLIQSSPPEPQATTPQYQQPTPIYPTYQAPLPPLPEIPPTTQPTSKKGTWKNLFGSSSEDDSSTTSKEKQSKVKLKKAASLSEQPKPPEIKVEPQVSFDLERGQTFADITPAIVPPSSSTQPTPPPPSKSSGKKESGFLASIFGSKKKSQESKEKQSKNQESESSKSKSSGQSSQYQRPGTAYNQQTVGAPVVNYYYARFPIHVERAIYRLSHIKLANPRRPLLQQVLLSNFMYGYLNLINKAAQPQVQQEVQQSQVQQAPQQELYVEQGQPEENVYYSGEEQPDYYGQDYYGAEYDDDPDDSIPQGHEANYGYGYEVSSSSQSPSQNTTYNKSSPNQPNGRHDTEDSSNAFILRDSRGRPLTLPKSGGGNSWTSGGQDDSYPGKRYH